MNTALPAPFAFAGIGALLGLFGGGFSQCFPVWVGAATGASIGCVFSVVICLKDERDSALPVAQPVSQGPVIIQNIYFVYDVNGQSKSVENGLPVTKAS
jgi:hypothetical protein